MELIDCRALDREIIELRMLESSPSAWQSNSEAWLIADNDQHLLHQDDRIIPVEYVDRGDRLRYEAGNCLWCLIIAKGTTLQLRALRCRGTLTLDLQIGVDDRLVDQLHRQGRISEPKTDAACNWLRDELLLGPAPRHSCTRALARTDNTGGLALVGRRHEADLRERDGSWRIARLTPVRQLNTELTLLNGQMDVVDASVAATLRSPAQRLQFKEYLDAHGDYVELWRRYAAIEWGQATDTGCQLGILRYSTREACGEEELKWRFQVDPEQARNFIERWENLTRDTKLPDPAIEACIEPPTWMVDDQQTKSTVSGRPVVGVHPVLDRDWLTLSYAQDRDHGAPPEEGLLCLAIHGQRKVHERREHALERIRTSTNPMPQLRILLEGQPVPIRGDWRREKPLSRHTRAAFRGEPTVVQKRAQDIALNTPDIAVIIGPPGTGKTQVISALQRRLSELYPDPQSIQYQLLITSFQHDAVDNALSRIQVFGLPPKRVGKRRDHIAGVENDWLAGWRQHCLTELQPKLEAIIAAEPVFDRLTEVRDAMTRLRIQPLTPGERAEQIWKIDGLLQRLADEHGLQPAAATERRWREWFGMQGREGTAGKNQSLLSRRLWRRGVWSQRVTAGAFADDGPSQCMRLLDLCERLDRRLADDHRRLLESLVTVVAPSRQELEKLSELREQLLTESRADLRPPTIRNVLNSEGCQLLDTLLVDLNAHLERRPEWARLATLQEYLDALKLDPRRIEQAVSAYTTVLGATCQQAASEFMRGTLGLDPNDGISFDTVVIDEAARATPLDLLIPMAMGRRRIVLVGDHRQLPHLLDPDTEEAMEQAGDLTEIEHNALRESLFERLVQGLRRLEQEHPGQPKRVVMLDTQFRMHPILGDFISRTFYEAADEPAIRSGRPPTDFEHHVPGLERCVCAWLNMPIHDSADQDQRHSTGSRIREVEAKRAAREARRILDDCPSLSVGVITFYAAQRDLILKCMGEQGLSEPFDGRWRVRPEWALDEMGAERLLVGTVDAFQGKEFDIVLLSIVRTDAPLRGDNHELALTRKFGFLRMPNRMNVAMSRQRRLLIAIGDIALARAPETVEAAPGLAAFLALCEGEHGRIL